MHHFWSSEDVRTKASNIPPGTTQNGFLEGSDVRERRLDERKGHEGDQVEPSPALDFPILPVLVKWRRRGLCSADRATRSYSAPP